MHRDEPQTTASEHPLSVEALPPLLTLRELLQLARRSESWYYQQKALEKRLGVRVLPQANSLGLFPKRAVLRWLDLL